MMMMMTAMNYMSLVELYSGWRQLCVRAQHCVQGSAATAYLICMLGAVINFSLQAAAATHEAAAAECMQPTPVCTNYYM
jgi:hypothetical protein